MVEWKNRPTDIRYWEENFECVLFVDENNSDNVKQIVKKIQENKEISENDRYFTLTGCLLTRDDYEILKEEFDFLKNKYWTNAKYFYEKKKQERVVCFHSREIRNRLNAFSLQEEKYQEFIIDLSKIIKILKFKIITVNIDMIHFAVEKEVEGNLYEYAFMKLLQAYQKELRQENGIIILEARGKKEDKSLHKYAKRLLKSEFDNIKGVFFNAKWNKNDGRTYSGLELADLCSYPIHKYIKLKKKDESFKIIENKIIDYKNAKDEIKLLL